MWDLNELEEVERQRLLDQVDPLRSGVWWPHGSINTEFEEETRLYEGACTLFCMAVSALFGGVMTLFVLSISGHIR
jgi:hypothetical protein